MRGSERLKLGAVLGVLATLLAVVPLAGAADVTRDQYVARVEPICEANTEANRKIFEGAKEEVKAGELKKGATHFFRAATALGKAIKQLKAVPQPTADEARLKKWIGYLEVEQSYFKRIGQALRAEDKPRAQSLSARLNRNSNLANNVVLAFGFNHCKIDPTRFA